MAIPLDTPPQESAYVEVEVPSPLESVDAAAVMVWMVSDF